MLTAWINLDYVLAAGLIGYWLLAQFAARMSSASPADTRRIIGGGPTVALVIGVAILAGNLI